MCVALVFTHLSVAEPFTCLLVVPVFASLTCVCSKTIHLPACSGSFFVLPSVCCTSSYPPVCSTSFHPPACSIIFHPHVCTIALFVTHLCVAPVLSHRTGHLGDGRRGHSAHCHLPLGCRHTPLGLPCWRCQLDSPFFTHSQTAFPSASCHTPTPSCPPSLQLPLLKMTVAAPTRKTGNGRQHYLHRFVVCMNSFPLHFQVQSFCSDTLWRNWHRSLTLIPVCKCKPDGQLHRDLTLTLIPLPVCRCKPDGQNDSNETFL